MISSSLNIQLKIRLPKSNSQFYHVKKYFDIAIAYLIQLIFDFPYAPIEKHPTRCVRRKIVICSTSHP